MLIKNNKSYIKAAVFGGGSVGSTNADALVRTGLFHFYHVVDPDNVENKNITKSIYRLSHDGMPKVQVLADHLCDLQGDKPRIYQKYFEQLTDEEWQSILGEVDMIFELADSRTGTACVIQKVREHYELTGKDVSIIKLLCADNLAASFFIYWAPGQESWQCPLCFMNSAQGVSSSDERIVQADENYSLDRFAGTQVQGVMPDLLFSLSFLTSAAHGIGGAILGRTTGRESLVAKILEGANVWLLSGFRNPYLEWQKDSPELMGKAIPLSSEIVQDCPTCGRKGQLDIKSETLLTDEMPVIEFNTLTRK